MPYHIEKMDDEFCVVKDSDSEVQGCHATESEAKAQIAALYSAENKAANYIKSNNLGLPTTFEELDSMLQEYRMGQLMEELLANYAFLINNILTDGYRGTETFDKIAQVTTQFTLRMSDLRDMITEVEDEEDDEEEETIGDVPDGVLKVVDEAIGLLDNLANKDTEIVTTLPVEESGVIIYKDNIGTYRWIARYSNNIRDNDNPSEIISAQSHKRFDNLVKAGVVEPPEFWIWHEKNWHIGQAEWTAIDEVDDYTFSVAGGYILPEFQHLAPELSAQTKDMRVSHGMPKWSVKRDKHDASVIVEHITKEISLLPSWAAANPFTGIVISKEHDMAFSEADKARLMEKHNISAALLDEITRANAGDVEKAADLELETKDAATPVVEAEVVQTPSGAVVEVAEIVEEIPVYDSVLPEEIVTTLEAVMKSVMVLNEKFDKEITNLKSKLTELEESEENRVAVKAATSPLASLTSMMVSSVIGDESTRVDGRTTLAKSKPVESDAGERHTGIPMIDAFINSGR